MCRFGDKTAMPADRLTSHIRLTPGLKKRLKIAAAENGRSLNEEVVVRLEGSFDIAAGERSAVVAQLKETLRLLEEGN
jgi:hypothetical protein